MTNVLHHWCSTPPIPGKFINLYRNGADHSVFCRAIQNGFFRGVEGSQVTKGQSPNGNDMWCYAHEPPNWDAIQKRLELKALDADIEGLRASLAELEAKRREMDEDPTP